MIDKQTDIVYIMETIQLILFISVFAFGSIIMYYEDLGGNIW